VGSDYPVYLSEEEVLQLHARVMGLYGGPLGLRDRGALEASLAQPRMSVFGHERFPGVPDKAAAYCFFIVRNHPFLDGNKRTGFLAALHFLLSNGLTPEFDETILAVAGGELEVEGLARVFRGACAPAPNGLGNQHPDEVDHE